MTARVSRPVRSAMALAGILLAGWLGPVPASAAATFVVNRTGDASDLKPGNGRCDTSSNTGVQCTLRAAIEEANGTAGADTIAFDIGGTAAVKVIAPATPLPAVTGAVTIDGYTQPGASPNTLATGNDAELKIQLSGTRAGDDADGLTVQADDSTIRGLVVNQFDRIGIDVLGSRNVVRGNFVGTTPGGNAARPNVLAGISVSQGADNTVGGTAPGARNLISGNNTGLVVGSSGPGPAPKATGTVVKGNYIGTNRSGGAALPNAFTGLVVVLSGTTTVGGTTPAARNVISANGFEGIHISGSRDTVVAGNFIGTDAAGTADLGNEGSGVVINNSPDNTIGGEVSGARNVISGNHSDGVRLSFIGVDRNTIQGNVIGGAASGGTTIPNEGNGIMIHAGKDNTVTGNVVAHNGEDGVHLIADTTTIGGNLVAGNGDDGVEVTVSSTFGQGNRILTNQIIGNAALGIDLAGGTEDAAGVTANDTDDPDTGANNLQNFPVLSSALRAQNGVTTVSGSLNSTPSREFTLQFFPADNEPSNHGEAVFLLGSKTVTTDSGGDVAFSFPTTALSPGQEVTATATDTTTGDTSEFSQNVIVTQLP